MRALQQPITTGLQQHETNRQSRQPSAISQQRNSTPTTANTPITQKRSLFNPSQSFASNPSAPPAFANPNRQQPIHQSQVPVTTKNTQPLNNNFIQTKVGQFAQTANLRNQSKTMTQSTYAGFSLKNTNNYQTTTQKQQQQQQKSATFKISKPLPLKSSATRKNETKPSHNGNTPLIHVSHHNEDDEDIPESPTKQLEYYRAKAAEIRKNGRRFIPQIAITDENKPPQENGDNRPLQVNQIQPQTLRLILSTRKHNWQDVIKNQLSNMQFTSIDLHFTDISVESFDRLLLPNQSRCLTHLHLNFSDNRFFNDESLVFLSQIKIPTLQSVKINVTGTQCSIVGANFLFFDFNYVDNVDIIVGNFLNSFQNGKTNQKKSCLTYKKNEMYINIDFSSQSSISKSEILSLSDSLIKSNHQNLLLDLSGIPFGEGPGQITLDKLRLLAKCLCDIQHLHIIFHSCKLTRSQVNVFLDSLLSDTQSQNDIRQKNTHIKSFILDIRDNFDDLDQSFLHTFLLFDSLSSIKLIIDCEKQVKQQYEGESAYCLGYPLIQQPQITSISIAVSDTHSIFHLNKLTRYLSIDAESCQVSAYKLVDIQKSLASYHNITSLNLILSQNWKLSFQNIRKLFENLPYFNQLQTVHLDIRSVFIYEIEFVTLYFLLHKIPQLTIAHDFQDSHLIHFSNNNRMLQLSFKGPFTRSKITSIHDMHTFCHAIESNMTTSPILTNLTTLHITFFFNYGLRGDSLLRLCTTISQFRSVTNLDLNFNSCFLQFEDIVFFCNGLNDIQNSPLESMKLTFSNNDSISSNSLVRIARILHRFPRLQKLHVICETQELILGMQSEHSQSVHQIIERFNNKQYNGIINLPVQRNDRVKAQIYSVLSHDIDKTVFVDRQLLYRQHQNEFLKQTQHVILNQLDPEAAEFERNIVQDIAESESINSSVPSLPSQSPPSSSNQLNIQEPQARNRILQTTVHNLVTLQFRDNIRYSTDELLQLGLDCALDSSLHQLITDPPKPEIDRLFNYLKRVRLAGLFFEQLAAPFMEFNPTQIFCDLYF